MSSWYHQKLKGSWGGDSSSCFFTDSDESINFFRVGNGTPERQPLPISLHRRFTGVDGRGLLLQWLLPRFAGRGSYVYASLSFLWLFFFNLSFIFLCFFGIYIETNSIFFLSTRFNYIDLARLSLLSDYNVLLKSIPVIFECFCFYSLLPMIYFVHQKLQ